MTIARARTTTTGLALVGALCLPMLGALAQKAAADDVPGVTILRLFEHDTQQTAIDLGPRGTGPGDQLLFAGDVFDQPGGTQLGHIAGKCTTMSGNATAGDVLCTVTFILGGGQLAVQAVADRGALFDRAEPVPIAIVGGTGMYATARGDGTFTATSQTEGTAVLNVVTG